MIKPILVLTALVLMGCTHTRTVDLDSMEADLALAEINDRAQQQTPKLKGNEWHMSKEVHHRSTLRPSTLEARGSKAIEVPELHVKPDSTSWWNEQLGSPETIATEEIYEISFKSGGQGVLTGFLVGGVIGFAVGFPFGVGLNKGSCESSDCRGKEAETGLQVSLVFGALFGLVGAGVGAAVGGKDTYRFVAPDPPPPVTSTYTPPHRQALRIRLRE